MKDNFTSEDLVQYLDGDLSGEDLQGLLDKLKADTAFRDEFQRLQIAREAIKIQGLRERIGNIHQQMMQELNANAAKDSTPVIPMFRRVMRIAAILIIVVGGTAVYEYTRLSSINIFENNYLPYVAAEQRGEPSGSALVNAFKAGENTKVIAEFQGMQKPAAQDYFYAGNAYLQLGKPALAILQFHELVALNISNQVHVFEDDTDYYLAMAYLQNGQATEAETLFEKIHSAKDHLYHDKVSKWLLWKVKLAHE